MKNKLIVAAGVLTAIATITLCGWIMFSPSVEDGTKTMLGFVIALVAIVVHIIAISMVKKGSLTVYSRKLSAVRVMERGIRNVLQSIYRIGMVNG